MPSKSSSYSILTDSHPRGWSGSAAQPGLVVALLLGTNPAPGTIFFNTFCSICPCELAKVSISETKQRRPILLPDQLVSVRLKICWRFDDLQLKDIASVDFILNLDISQIFYCAPEYRHWSGHRYVRKGSNFVSGNFSGKGSSLAFWHGCKNERHDPDGQPGFARCEFCDISRLNYVFVYISMPLHFYRAHVPSEMPP